MRIELVYFSPSPHSLVLLSLTFTSDVKKSAGVSLLPTHTVKVLRSLWPASGDITPIVWNIAYSREIERERERERERDR